MRVALITDTHLSARAPECVANWHAARRATERVGAELTLTAYEALFGAGHWQVAAGRWNVVGINAQLVGSGSSFQGTRTSSWTSPAPASGTCGCRRPPS